MSDLIERLRSVPKVWAGHVMHEDGIVPADGRIVHEAADEIERLTAERAELRRQLAEAELDAQRYRWLRPRLFAADFEYGDPPICAIVFRWPESAKISANLDREIDAAMGASNE